MRKIANKYKYEVVFAPIVVASLFLIVGFFLQSVIIFNWDVSSLLLNSRRLLNGGKYFYNFFEINPPMILYIYSVPVLLVKYLHLSMILVFRCYCFFLIAGSLFLVEKIIRNISVGENSKQIIFVSITFALIFLPNVQFGQREHLALVFMIPYFLLFLSDRLAFKKTFLVIIGVLAGIGFLIKPHFLLVFALLEFVCLVKNKKILVCFRVEAAMVLLVAMIYLASIYFFTPEYLSKMLPFILHYYIGGVGYSVAYKKLFFNTYTLFFYVGMALFMLFRNSDSQFIDLDYFASAASGFFIVYLIQDRIWTYHIYPFLALVFLILVVLSLSLYEKIKIKSKTRNFIAIMLSLSLLIIPLGKTFYDYMLGYKFLHSPDFQNLVSVLKAEAINKKILKFNTSATPIFPAIDYANVTPVTRFNIYWILPEIVLSKKITAADKQKLKKFLLSAVMSDIKANHPALILIDQSKHKTHMGLHEFEYLKFFSDSKAFNNFFASLKYEKNIQCITVYKTPSRID